MLDVGTELQGRYKIEQILGEGGFGCVYLAREKMLDKVLAIKEMLLDASTDPERQAKATRQFQREARILAALRHPQLVDVTHFFEENRQQYLVMEYVPGQTLGDLARTAGKPFPVAQVVEWLQQLCQLLDYVHTRQPPVVLRDIKPGNIMLDANGVIRVIDFGIARTLEPGSETTSFIKGTGTHGYAPVEQYVDSTDTRSDIYSLGATVYYLLTLTTPPPSVCLVEDGMVLEPPSSLNATVTLDLERVILKMMAVKRENRYQSAQEVKQALDALPPPGSTPVVADPRPAARSPGVLASPPGVPTKPPSLRPKPPAPMPKPPGVLTKPPSVVPGPPAVGEKPPPFPQKPPPVYMVPPPPAVEKPPPFPPKVTPPADDTPSRLPPGPAASPQETPAASVPARIVPDVQGGAIPPPTADPAPVAAVKPTPADRETATSDTPARNRTWLWAGGVVLLLLTAAVVAWMLQPRATVHPGRPTPRPKPTRSAPH